MRKYWKIVIRKVLRKSDEKVLINGGKKVLINSDEKVLINSDEKIFIIMRKHSNFAEHLLFRYHACTF